MRTREGGWYGMVTTLWSLTPCAGTIRLQTDKLVPLSSTRKSLGKISFTMNNEVNQMKYLETWQMLRDGPNRNPIDYIGQVRV